MKKYCKLFILAAALMGGLSLNSCIDLDPIDYSDINPSNFPQTETDVESMVNSCYYSVRSSWFDGLFSTSERGVTVVNDLTTQIQMHTATVGSMTSAAAPPYWHRLKHATS